MKMYKAHHFGTPSVEEVDVDSVIMDDETNLAIIVDGRTANTEHFSYLKTEEEAWKEIELRINMNISCLEVQIDYEKERLGMLKDIKKALASESNKGL